MMKNVAVINSGYRPQQRVRRLADRIFGGLLADEACVVPATMGSSRMTVHSAAKDAADKAAADGDNAGDALHQFISFAIGDDQYGVDIMAVREIKGWSQINPLPGQPDYMRGVLNLRGAMVPIVDLRCRFGQGMTEATPLHVVIVTQIAGRPIGLLADQVLDIVDVEPARIQPVPRIAEAAQADFLSGLVNIDSGMVALIDLPRLLTVSMAEGASLETGTHHAAA
jgi:purine-binding chemotaxis protein CheW